MEKVLDYSKLFKQKNIGANVWLLIPKDVWRCIIIFALDDRCKTKIGYFDYDTLWKLRIVCHFFANLIDPLFCLKIIYMNPNADKCRLTCAKCSHDEMCQKKYWMYHKNKNPYFNKENEYKRKKWKWVENPEFGKIERKKRVNMFSGIIKHASKKINVKYPIEVREQNVFFTRHTRKLATNAFSRNFSCKKWKLTKNDRTTPERCTPNHKKTKFWKRTKARTVINRPTCSVGCDCQQCIDIQDSNYSSGEYLYKKRPMNYYRHVGKIFYNSEESSEESSCYD